ncbi:hypothetical protein DFH06DRAFT_143034 [Mycena polygramma]|nr:hypothetical protein DFH06DRAFT_143034 [Mycena polygramma]
MWEKGEGRRIQSLSLWFFPVHASGPVFVGYHVIATPVYESLFSTPSISPAREVAFAGPRRRRAMLLCVRGTAGAGWCGWCWGLDSVAVAPAAQRRSAWVLSFYRVNIDDGERMS